KRNEGADDHSVWRHHFRYSHFRKVAEESRGERRGRRSRLARPAAAPRPAVASNPGSRHPRQSTRQDLLVPVCDARGGTSNYENRPTALSRPNAWRIYRHGDVLRKRDCGLPSLLSSSTRKPQISRLPLGGVPPQNPSAKN